MNLSELQNEAGWFPEAQTKSRHLYIFLTSLNLGGAEKIVADQLWAMYRLGVKDQATLFVLHEKEKEHRLPPNVQVVRLNGKIENGEALLRHVAFQKEPMVCHLLNDTMLSYLISLGVRPTVVIHNDRRGWQNSNEMLNNESIVALVSVCNHVTRQLKEVSSRPIVTLRHQIHYHGKLFDEEKRALIREGFGFAASDKVVGMVGRICNQKNYITAIRALAELKKTRAGVKLMIVGGFVKGDQPIYLELVREAKRLEVDVVFAGFRTDVDALFNSFDIGLNTSHYEGLSMATQEFMMNGLTVVCANVSGQGEIRDPTHLLKFFEPAKAVECVDERGGRWSAVDAEDYDRSVKDVAALLDAALERLGARIQMSEKEKSDIDDVVYGSHGMWNLLHSIMPEEVAKKNRLLFVTQNLNLGGAQRSLTNLLSHRSAKIWDASLAILNKSNHVEFHNELMLARVKCVHIAERHSFIIARELIHHIQENRIEKVVFWSVDAKVKLLVQKMLGHKTKFVDVSPGNYCFEEMERLKWFQGAIYHSDDAYFGALLKFVSKYDDKNTSFDYKNRLSAPVEVVQNGVPFNEENVRKAGRRELGEMKFVVVGRLTQSKHVDVIFEAFEALLKNGDDVSSIHFYGSVEPYSKAYMEMLSVKHEELLASGRVHFHGNVDDPKKVFKSFDCLVVLGTHQGCPNTVLEGVVCGVPCIANDSGGTREIIDETTGVLLPEIPNASLLTAAMMDVRDRLEVYEAKAAVALGRVKQRFAMEEMVQKYGELLHD